MRILVVDDSLDSRLLLEAMLKAAGYMGFVGVDSAQAAFNHLECLDGEAVDLILMDLVMPGMNGIEACLKVKLTPGLEDIPIIMVTARSEEADLDAAFGAGAMDYIIKPIGKVELLARVRAALRLKGEMDSRKQAPEDLEQKNRELEEESLAKTQVLSTASHELKTPLTSIVGYTKRLLFQQQTLGPLNERQRRYVEVVYEESMRLKVLVDDILDVSRIEAGRLELTLVELDIQNEVGKVLGPCKPRLTKNRSASQSTSQAAQITSWRTASDFLRS